MPGHPAAKTADSGYSAETAAARSARQDCAAAGAATGVPPSSDYRFSG